MRMIATTLALVLMAPLPTGAFAGTAESGVVGIEVTHQQWNPDHPWSKNKPETRHASGVIVEGPYILTTAQMIADATYIQLKKYDRGTQATARPFVVDREVNLALLEVDPPQFFDGLRPVHLAKQTPVRGVLRTVRWQKQQLESLASRIKRFEVQQSYFGKLEHVFLIAQTDMSGGGWAEPVFDGDGLLVGITTSQKEQRARVIPVEIISKYLEKARREDPYTDFPVFGANWQVNEDPALAAYLGQAGGPRGVLIRQVPWGSSACGVLKPRDILLSMDGKWIDAEGFYTHPRLGQLLFAHILTDGHDVGDTVPIRVIRQGREMELEMALRGYPDSLTLMPGRHGDDPPPFVVAGGFVLRELDGDYLASWGPDWAKRAPLHLKTIFYERRHAQRRDLRRVVLLTSVLPSPYNVGYQDLQDIAVESINGRPIDSIPSVVEAFAHPVDGFHTIVLVPNASRREIVLDASQFDAATAAILEHYRIPESVRTPSSAPPDGGPECPGDY